MTKKTFDHDISPSENHAVLTPVPTEDVFGFYGTMKDMVGEEMATKLWDSASMIVSTTFCEDDPVVVRNFLRSNHGRYLADRVTSLAKEENYSDTTIMYDTLSSTISEVGRNGQMFWKQQFDLVRQATINGEWED